MVAMSANKKTRSSSNSNGPGAKASAVDALFARLPDSIRTELTAGGRVPPPPVALDMLRRIPADKLDDIPVVDLRVLLSRPGVSERDRYMRWYRRAKKYGIPTDAAAFGGTSAQSDKAASNVPRRPVMDPPPIGQLPDDPAIQHAVAALGYARRSLRHALNEVDAALSVLSAPSRNGNENDG